MALYTEAQIRDFSDAQLEAFAANLEWKDRYGVRHFSRYRERGFPQYYNYTKVVSRAEFLRLRLLASKTQTWNPEALTERIAAKKAARAKTEAIEAAKPKVEIKVRPSVEALLKDYRPNGRTFSIVQNGQYIKCSQKQGSGAVGRSVCTQVIHLTAAQFKTAIEAAATVVVSELDLKEGIHISIYVRADGYTLNFIGTTGDIIQIWEGNISISDLSQRWHFKISDLRTVIAAMEKKYNFVPVEEEKKEEVVA